MLSSAHCEILWISDARTFFSRLLAVNDFFFFVILLDSPHPHSLHAFPNRPSLTGLVFILAEVPLALYPIVCWGGSFHGQPKEPQLCMGMRMRMRRIGGQLRVDELSMSQRPPSQSCGQSLAPTSSDTDYT